MLFWIIGFSIMVLIAPILEAISEVKISRPEKKFKNALGGAATILIAEAVVVGLIMVIAMS